MKLDNVYKASGIAVACYKCSINGHFHGVYSPWNMVALDTITGKVCFPQVDTPKTVASSE